MDRVGYYSQIASSYIKPTEYSKTYHARRFRTFNSLLPKGSLDLLDFGAGSGENIIEMAALGHRVIGIDLSPEMVALGKNKIPATCSLAVGGVPELRTYGDESFDAVCALNVLPYLSTAEEAEFFSQARRILRPAGCVVFTHTNALIDLVTMNRYTVEFYRDHIIPLLTEDVAEREEFQGHLAAHLTSPNQPTRSESSSEREKIPKRRINPISYPKELERLHSLRIDSIEFEHYYPMPPQFMEASNHKLKIFDFADRMKGNPLSYVFASIVMMRGKFF
jgi:ubiquinone/menaquinone biosynthesis C-methylase UbiE